MKRRVGAVAGLGAALMAFSSAGLSIDTATLPAGTVAEAYSATLAASGGTPPYAWNVREVYEETVVTNAFPTAADQQAAWTNDASAWHLDLPFTFPFYGVGYTQCWVSSEGYLHFTGPYVNETPSVDTLATNTMIAAGWKNLAFNHEVYLLTNATQCVVRWVGKTMGSGSVNVAVELNADGTIRINLSLDADMMFLRVAGVSAGNGADYTVSVNAGPMPPLMPSESDGNGADYTVSVNAGPMPLMPGEYIKMSPTDRLPEGLLLAGNQIAGTPTAIGTTAVAFAACDATGAFAARTLALIVGENVNELPVVTGRAPPADTVVMNAGTNATFSVTASDPESQPLEYAWLWDGAAAGDTASFMHSSDWTDEGDHTLAVAVSDGFWTNGEVSVTWTVTIRSDNDSDDMPNAWERTYGLDPNVNDAGQDPDDDRLTNLQEYQHGCNPTNPDTDGDSLTDGWEEDYAANPTHVTEAVPGYTNFSWRGVFNLTAPAYGVCLQGSKLYAACSYGGLKVFDVSDPAAIQLLDMVEISRGPGSEEGARGYARDVVVADGRAYVCADEEALQVWDVSDATKVVKLGEYKNSSSSYRRVQVVSGRAYLATRNALEVLDVSNPAAISLITQTTIGLDSLRDLAVHDNFVYIANYSEGLYTVDASNLPEAPVVVNIQAFEAVGVCGYAARALVVSGDFLFLAQDGYGVMAFSISNGVPELLDYERPDGMPFPYDGLCDLAVVGDVVCAAGGKDLWTVDIHSPGSLTTLGHWIYPEEGYIDYIDVDGDVACVNLGYAGLCTIDIGTPATPAALGTYATSGQPHDLAVVDNRAYIANGDTGLHVIDVSVATNWYRACRYDTAGEARGIAVYDGGATVCVADGENGVIVFDASDPDQLTVQSAYDTSGFAWGVARLGNRLAVADGDNGLVILTNLNALTLETTLALPGKALDVEAVDERILGAAGGAGLMSYRFLDGVGWDAQACNYSVDAGGSVYAKRVTAGGGYAWLADWYRGVVAVDLAGLEPVYAGQYDPGAASGEAVFYEDDYVWLGTSANLLSVYLGNPAEPRAVVSMAGSIAGERLVSGVWVAGTNGLLLSNDPWSAPLWELYGFNVDRLDSDSDGLPDDWERAYFGGLDQGRHDDFDGDGVSEWGELLTGLDPTEADSDNDRLLDGEEILQGTNPFMDDTDGDGVIDGDEIRAGSNPLLAGSLFRFEPLLGLALSGEIVIRWSSFSDHTYNLFRAPNLAEMDDWVQLLTNAPATPPINCHTDRVFGTSQFYLIKSSETP